MPRPRTNDPSNLPAKPRLECTHEREAEIVSEFQRRLVFIRGNYCLARSAIEEDYHWYNSSLARLRRRVRKEHRPMERGERIHPEIESVISHHARKLAATENCEVR